jgi:outer membrane autotransporter protein
MRWYRSSLFCADRLSIIRRSLESNRVSFSQRLRLRNDGLIAVLAAFFMLGPGMGEALAQQNSAAFPNLTCADLAANPVTATIEQGSGQGAFNVKNLTSFEMQPGDTVVFSAINPIDNNPPTGDPRWRLSKSGQGPGNGFLVGMMGNPNNPGNFERVVDVPLATFENTTNSVINTSYSAQIFTGSPQDPKNASFQLKCSCIPAPPPNTANLTVTKIVNGTNKLFDFNATPSPGMFQLSDAQSNIQNGITPAVFTITETPDPNYTLDSIDCIGNAAPETVTLGTGEVIVNVQDGENVICTYTNSEIQQPGTGNLTVVKRVIGTDKDFAFTGDPPFGNFSLSDGQANVQNNLTPGAFTITEALDPDYTLLSIDCLGNGTPETVTLGAGEVVVDVAATENIVCTFTNRENVDPPDDPRMEEETKRFIHRRVDNLLTHGPDRARMLRRLSEREPKSAKDSEPLKLSGSSTKGSLTHGATPIASQRLAFAGKSAMARPGTPEFGFAGVNAYETQNLIGDGTAPEGLGLAGRRSTNPFFDAVAGQAASMLGGQTSLKFGTSLSGIRQKAAQHEAEKQRRKITDAGLNLTAHPLTHPFVQSTTGWDFWIEGQISRYNDDVGGVNREGDFRILYVGADYIMAPGVLLGLLAQIDDTTEDLNQPGETGELEGTGWMVGPYFGLRLRDNLFFDARAAWGQSDNDIRLRDAALGFRSGSFETDRWLATATLTGNEYYGAWRFSPQIGVAYGHEEFDDFRNSQGALIPGADASIGRATGTLEIGYRLMTSRGTRIEPHVAISGIWNFNSDDLIINGALVNTDDTRGRIEGGVLVTTPRGWSFRAAVNYDGIGGDDFESYGGSLWLNIPLHE